MSNLEKFKGVFPAFYACYDEKGEVSPEGVRALTRYYIEKGMKGTYVGGSSGECIYQSVAERKLVLENVMTEAKGKLTVIAHVACNNTGDSMELAAHAESLGVDAIAAIPPIYFHLPDYAIADYWNSISAAAPNTKFIIYNIPQLAGVALTVSLCKKMRENPQVIGVKNSSPYVQDIMDFKAACGEDFILYNGPDEQFVAGYAIGADGGIGGTYTVMPELFLKMDELMKKGEVVCANEIQSKVLAIIKTMVSGHGNLYDVMKYILRHRDGLDLGSVRSPLPRMVDSDIAIAEKAEKMITETIQQYC